MNAKETYPYSPDYAVCPGETILEVIESQGITKEEFAERVGITPKHLIDLCKGTAPITQEMALRLERVTGTPSRLWCNLETNYRQTLLRLQEQKDREETKAWMKSIPFQERINRDQIPECGGAVK